MDTPFDLETTDHLLSTTRAVRRRLDLGRPVPRQLILDCIRLSQQAPTGSNVQSWRWLVVDDADTRARLARIYREMAREALWMGRSIYATTPQSSRVYDSAEWLAEHLHEVPVHVIPCVVGKFGELTSNAGAAAMYGSIIPAVWSFQLALRSRGLGSTYTTLHLFREAEAAALLGIPDGVMQVALLPVGWTRGTDFKPAARPGPESITHWNRWSS